MRFFTRTFILTFFSIFFIGLSFGCSGNFTSLDGWDSGSGERQEAPPFVGFILMVKKNSDFKQIGGAEPYIDGDTSIIFNFPLEELNSLSTREAFIMVQQACDKEATSIEMRKSIGMITFNWGSYEAVLYEVVGPGHSYYEISCYNN